MDISEKDLKKIEWLLMKEKSTKKEIIPYKPIYEDPAKFNTERTILDNVGRKMMDTLAQDIMDLMDTSIAVYEKNGDYAYGQFDSTWCQLMDSSSFKLCNTGDTKKALTCGEWLCHENCWHDSAKQAIITGKPTDIECVGGIHLYAEPIKIDNLVIGSINIGYGNPPQEEKTLVELADKYHIDKKEIIKRAKEYKPRPPFIIENAKKRLKTVAQLIGQIVENSNAKKKLQESEELLNATGSMAKVGGWEINLEDNTVEWTKAIREIHEVTEDYNPTLEEALNFFPGDAKNKIENAVRLAQEKGISYDMIVPFKTAKDKRLWVHTIGTPVFKNGKCIRLHGTFQDVTDQYTAELKLKEQELVFKRTEEIAHVGSWEWDIATDTVTWSDELFRIFKIDSKKGTPSYADHPKIYTPGSMKKLDEAVQKAIKTGESYDLDLDIIRSNGEIRHCVALGYAKKDEKGKIIKLYGSFQDITKRKQIENAIKQKEHESNEMLDKMLNAFVLFESVFDDKGKFISYRFLSINKAYEEITGVKSEEVKGKTVHEVWPETEPEWVKKYGDVAISGKSQEFELYHAPTKKLYHCQVYRPFNTKEKFCVIFEDITDKKQAELKLKQLNEELAAQNEEYESLNEELRQTIEQLSSAKKKAEESEKKLSSMYNNSPLGIFRSTPAGKIISVNSAFLKIYGFNNLQELKSIHAKEFYTNKEDRTKMLNSLKKYGFVKDYITKERKKDGSLIWVKTNYSAIKGNNGEIELIDGILEDITQSIQAENEIKKHEERFRNIIDSTPFPVAVVDPSDQKIFYWSKSAIKKFGHNPTKVEEWYGLAYPDPDYRANVINRWKPFLEKAAKSEEAINTGEYKVSCKDGSVKTCEIYANFIPGYLIVTLSDISEKKESEMIIKEVNEELAAQNEEYENLNEELKQTIEELQFAKEKAEENDRLKSAFLANMSHEIRTPMNGILGFTDLLKKPGLSGEKKEKYVDVIQKSGKRMLDTINDIVEISKIEAGDIEPVYSEMNINKQLEYYYEFFKPEVDKKNIELSLNNGLPNKESNISTDVNMFNSILTNLIKNAIKYSDSGHIEFGYNLQKQDELEFYVKDTGIGIPKNRHKAIFDRFVQADITDTRAFQGSGLGLSITKAYVEILEGNIWLESKENMGTTFYFTLPYVQSESIIENIIDKNRLKPGQSMKELKILIVEDDRTSDMHLSILLEESAKEIIHATTGAEAIELCKKHKGIDLILMDIKLPNSNGYDATKKIREFNKDVVIIAETAYAMKGDREKALEAGCNDYITKPIDEKELLKLINKYFD